MNGSLLRRTLVALLVGCAMLIAVPAANAAPAAPKAKVAVHAKAEKDRVRVGEKLKIDGSLDLARESRIDGGTEPVVVQSLQGGMWVDLDSDSCHPDGTFGISVSFDFSAQLTLRVFHPETDLYASAYSDVFGVLVL
ncbi:hypothetical protein HFP15_18075 [Amycolatopsis sp. K13G38]|uniref:Secreted protein n=1 Tax=Amycolatopsis acididurans TaxID=2724524 RepID=A0ABX1J4R3_9PSEU|nr:hypothetical protein [Amycolatopsis acididurans]NKQ54795.1 hypothetical protein [Amycolatopsis acididurans]